MIITRIGILDWTIKGLEEQIDIRTTKTLKMTGSFHKYSDKDKLYVPRNEGGRGLKNTEERNHLLESVYSHEQERIIRIGKEYERMYISENEENKQDELTSRAAAKKVKNVLQDNHKAAWIDKKDTFNEK